MPTKSTCAKCGWSCTLPGRQVAAACPACGHTVIWYRSGTFVGGGSGVWLVLIPFLVLGLFFASVLGFCLCLGLLGQIGPSSAPTDRAPEVKTPEAPPAPEPQNR
jgi:hypothetical protein